MSFPLSNPLRIKLWRSGWSLRPIGDCFTLPLDSSSLVQHVCVATGPHSLRTSIDWFSSLNSKCDAAGLLGTSGSSTHQVYAKKSLSSHCKPSDIAARKLLTGSFPLCRAVTWSYIIHFALSCRQVAGFRDQWSLFYIRIGLIESCSICACREWS